MEVIREMVIHQPTIFCIPFAIVIVGILIFTFGFKSAEQPAFDQLTLEDRKPSNKKRKTKEKKSPANGHISAAESKTDKSPSKESKRSQVSNVESPKVKKVESSKVEKNNKKTELLKTKSIEEIKNKKNLRKTNNEKPVDFDEGNWETVPTKSDKKKKPEQSPAKKDNKKNKKSDKALEIDKFVKEVVNKELKEQEEEKKKEILAEKEADIDETPKKVELIIEDAPQAVGEEKKEKKKEKKARKDSEKSRKDSEKSDHQPEVSLPEKESPPAKKAEPQQEAKDRVAPEVVKEDSKQVEPSSKAGVVAFDELGDVWTEAKVQKKSKKKTRRDN